MLYFRSLTNVNVPAGVSLRGESPGLRPPARQRGAESHAGGEAPQRLPGNVRPRRRFSGDPAGVFFAQSRSLLCVFVNKHTQDDTLDYECVLDIERQSVVVEATVEPDATGSSYLITCEPHQVRKCLCVSQE